MGANHVIEQLKQEILLALKELVEAAQELVNTSDLPFPPLRPRIFQFAPGVCYPCVRDHGWAGFFKVKVVSKSSSSDFITDLRYGTSYYPIKDILNACRLQPRFVLRAVRRIEAAAEWCRKRAEGRRRQYEELLRQQGKALKALEARAVARKLSSGS